MPRRSGFVVIPVALALGIVWACEKKSPVGPTPPPSCTYTLSTAALSFGANGGTDSVAVATAAACAWTAASDRGWMTITAGASASGPGSAKVAVTANPSPDARSGTLTVAGQAVAVRLDGTPLVCDITVSPTSASFNNKDAVTGSFDVLAPAACSWIATTTASWVSISSGASGTGNGRVGYNVTDNRNVDPRTAVIHVGAATFTISQAGDTPAPACDFEVAPVQINACMSAPYELATTVTTQASCGWTATSDAPWVSISGSASRSGPGELRFRIGDNYDAPRLGVVKIRWDTPTAGQNVQVSQAGCHYAVSPSSITAPAAGGAYTFNVLQESEPYECGGATQDRCVWSATTDATWITITTSMPRAGDDRVSFTVAQNTTGAARTARITVRDQVVVVSQAQ